MIAEATSESESDEGEYEEYDILGLSDDENNESNQLGSIAEESDADSVSEPQLKRRRVI